MSQGRLRIAIVTDGRPANRVQAEGLAEAIARREEADIQRHDVNVKPLWPTLALRARLPHLMDVPQADLVIGAGRRGNLVAAAARRAGAKSVAILRPPLPLSHYDAVVVPDHDRLLGDNVVTTLGALNALTPGRIAEAARNIAPLPPRTLAVLIGGPSRSADFGPSGEARLIEDLDGFAAEGWTLAATPSRRTPEGLMDRLTARFPRMIAWNGAPPNPYPGWLSHAEAILVTADSVNMASEAAATGKPVFVSGKSASDSKFAAFHAALAARGITRDAAHGPDHWTYPPLREADRVAPLVRDLTAR
ncbi:mitochondrial fission ELM1 family protein [Roseobacter sp. HKCCA0434]|uniref:mitochondrial fission ELM1 family protein n=1 Tax=Roseobacter sp. HKCCA0434 TaxID=3079297 RepID=UPI002905B844|nr:mitochondrial fission ELM1 family protein [Roseobacter sp. HKCCA0434]